MVVLLLMKNKSLFSFESLYWNKKNNCKVTGVPIQLCLFIPFTRFILSRKDFHNILTFVHCCCNNAIRITSGNAVVAHVSK